MFYLPQANFTLSIDKNITMQNGTMQVNVNQSTTVPTVQLGTDDPDEGDTPPMPIHHHHHDPHDYHHHHPAQHHHPHPQ